MTAVQGSWTLIIVFTSIFPNCIAVAFLFVVDSQIVVPIYLVRMITVSSKNALSKFDQG